MRQTQKELDNGGAVSSTTLSESGHNNDDDDDNNNMNNNDHLNTMNLNDRDENDEEKENRVKQNKSNASGSSQQELRRRRVDQTESKITPKERMRNAWRMWRLRKRWEREYDKNGAVPAPFVAIHIKDKRGSMQASLILMFALMQCICGFVFPICDAFALTDKWTQFAINHKYYLEAFLLSQYIGAILVLAYLQTLICYYSEPYDKIDESSKKVVPNAKKESGHKLMEKASENRVFTPTPEASCNGGSDQPRDSEEHHRFSFSGIARRASLIPFNCYPIKVSERKRLSWHEDGMNLYLRLGAVGFGLGVMIHDGFNLSSAWELERPSCHSALWIPKHVLRLIWVLWQTYFVFKYHRLVLHAHKFCVRLAFTHLAAVNLCQWLKVVISEISDTFKREVANQANRSTANWTMLNLTETGCGTVALDRLNETLHGSTNPHKPVVYENQPYRPCEGHLGETLKPFLYPLAIEYSLITGTLFYKMLQRVGDRLAPTKLMTYPSYSSLYNTQFFGGNSSGSKIPSVNSMLSYRRELSPPSGSHFATGINSPSPLDDTSSVLTMTTTTVCYKHTSYRQLLGCRVYLSPEVKEEELQSSQKDSTKCSAFHSRLSDFRRRRNENYCHRSHTGLFLGLMLFLACTIGVIFSISRGMSTLSKLTPYIYQHSKIFMLSVSMIACVIALVQTYSMKFRRIKATESFEYNLLGIGLIGCLTYHMLLFVPALETVVHAILYRLAVEQTDVALRTLDSTQPIDIEKLHGPALLYIVKCTLEVCQALLQFFFIVEASRRGPCCRNQAAIKPGRSAIIFLLITNLALWLMNTFEFRQSEYQLTLHRQYYGINTWSVIQCCFIPLIIFFRFHSTVCLAQIWSKLYAIR